MPVIVTISEVIFKNNYDRQNVISDIINLNKAHKECINSLYVNRYIDSDDMIFLDNINKKFYNNAIMRVNKNEWRYS